MAAVAELRHMNIYGGEWLKYQGHVHQPTVQAVVRHELGHMFSFDYAAPLEASVPFIYEPQARGWLEKAQLGRSLYEGLTEVLARTASAAEGGEQSVEQGYRGGATLSAFTLRELLGQTELFQAYLRHDTRQLRRLFEAKIGLDSCYALTQSVNAGAAIFNDGYDESLDFLHRAFQSKAIGKEKMDKIFDKARREWIDERAGHHEAGGFSATTHLFKVSDADEPECYALNAVAEAPPVYRFNRKKDRDGFERTEPFILKIMSSPMSSARREAVIAGAAASLKAHCEISEPDKISLESAYGMIGFDEYIEGRLALLPRAEENKATFEKLWAEIDVHAAELIVATTKKIYEAAGVAGLIANDRR